MRRRVPLDRDWLLLAGADAVAIAALLLLDWRILVGALITGAWLLLVAIGGLTDGER